MTDYYSDVEEDPTILSPPPTFVQSKNYVSSPPPRSMNKIQNNMSTSNIKQERSTPKIVALAVSTHHENEYEVHLTFHFQNDRMTSDDEDVDYDYTSKWEYLGKGIWENQDYGSMSNYSTLKSAAPGGGETRPRPQPDTVDYDTLSRSGFVSEEELEKETGAGPRGDRSRYIETDGGLVQSKYR